MDKVLGDTLSVQSNTGNVSINSCYSQSSKICSSSGNLTLRNVHRNCEISITDEANLEMTGFNGNLVLTMNAGTANLQISELHGESVIVANNATDISLNLADGVVQSTYVHASVPAENVLLSPELEQLRGVKENGATTIQEKDAMANKLFVQTPGKLDIRKMSWMDSIIKRQP